MDFVDREKELELLKQLRRPRAAVVGRRRVGKTTLVEHSHAHVLTLYVPAEKTEAEIIRDWVAEYPSLGLPRVASFKEFFEYLFTKERKHLVFIDEIQNTLKVNPAFIYDLQRLLDKHKEAGLMVSGSYISLMKNLLEKYKAPLYGRFDFILHLKELPFRAVAGLCRKLGYSFEEAIRFYLVFGGIPKYYETLERMGSPPFEEAVEKLFLVYPRPLNEEVKAMLREEFGKEHKMFFSILSAVALGKNTLQEIADYSGKKQTELTKYINMLRDEFEILGREIPATERKTKRGLYVIAPSIFSFWLYFVWRNYYLLERNLDEAAVDYFKKEINLYLGRKFEMLCREALIELNAKKKLPFSISMLGRQWGKDREGIPYEIDIAALNRTTSQILFAECKWAAGVDAAVVLEKLRKKAAVVEWNKGKRKEYYMLFAKSFVKKAKEENTFLFDLDDLKELFK